MKKRTIALVTALVLSAVVLMLTGAYLKYEILAPYQIAQDKNIVELPFLLMTDDALRYEVKLAFQPEESGDDFEKDPTDPSTEAPTTEPTEPPTEAPTTGPTEPPTEAPTTGPTEPPTEAPTTGPTEPPTEAPTTEPTEPPTEEPTTAPTEAPATEPTETHTTEPSTSESTDPDHVHDYCYYTVVEATCSEDGYTWHQCECGKGYSDSFVDSLGHSYKDTCYEATCATEGYTLHVCSTCGKSYQDGWTDKLPHSYTSVVVDPTETADGYTEYSCTVCGHSYRDNYIYVDKPTEPTTVPPTEPPTEPPKSSTYPGYDFSGGVDSTWYEDVLFIGDSRTVGLREYARSGNADYFCGVGMSVFNIQTSKTEDLGFTKQYLEDLLASRTYGKVFINLGINECGYSTSSLVSAYKDLIKLVQKYQPNAKIVIQAIMTVTKNYAGGASYFQPDHIFSINRKLANLADGASVFYIDVNVYFTDQDGFLYRDLTGDGCHLYASYYRVWRDWIGYEAARLGI